MNRRAHAAEACALPLAEAGTIRGEPGERTRRPAPGFYVGETGSVSSGKALDKMLADQLKLAGERSIPITIVVLLPVVGALVAVGVPLLALSGVIATTGADPYRLHRPAVHPAPVGGRPFCSHCRA